MVILEVSRGLPTKRYPMNGIFEWDQAKALKQLGHDVIFIAIDLRSIRRKRKWGLSIQRLDGITVYNINIPLGRVLKKISNRIKWLALKKIYKIIQSNHGGVDVVHYHFGRSMCYVGLKAKRQFGLKYIVTEHESTIYKNQISDKDKRCLKEFYHEAEVRIAVSESFKTRLEEIFDEKFDYVPNVIDLSAICDCKKVYHDGYIFVTVGNLIERKGMDVTIKAFATLHKSNKNVKLIIIGDGSERGHLTELVKVCEVEDAVFFRGRLTREQIKEEFSSSDCFILLSRAETFGVVYIEAMAAGLPVIATKCGGPECFVNDTNGKLIDVDNIDQAVVAMNEMLQKKYDRNKLRQFCLDNFAPNVVANKITLLMKENEIGN